MWVNHLGDDKIPNANNSWTFRLWYRRTFDLSWTSGRTLLHFGAVDWEATVFLNGKMIGKHTGGYDAFSFDVTDHVKAKGNELLVLGKCANILHFLICREAPAIGPHLVAIS